VEALHRIQTGEAAFEKQDGSQATHAPLLKKEDGAIDWRRPAAEIHNQVRGLQPWPGAYTSFRGQTLHVWKAKVAQGAGSPGAIIGVKPLMAACGEGALELQELQLEGRKRLPAAEFANGQRLQENEIFGAPSPEPRP